MRHLNWSAMFGSLLAIFLPAQTTPQPPVNAPPVNPDMTWTILLSRAGPPAGTPPGGSRGPDDGIVPIVPGTISAETWSSSPLFLWQGTARQLELVTAAGSIIWSHRLAETAQHCFYTGAPLASGAYEWILYSLDKVAMTRVAFQVMQPQEQARIEADLATLNAQLPTATSEQLARQRASYFAERQLWSDVFREAFSVIEPSEDLAALLQALPAELVG